MPIPETGRKERILQTERAEYTMQMKKMRDFCLKISVEMKIYLNNHGFIDVANSDEIKRLHFELLLYLNGDENKHKIFDENESRKVLAQKIKENALSAEDLCADLFERVTKMTHFQITREEQYYFGEIDNLLCSLCHDISRLITLSVNSGVVVSKTKIPPSLWYVFLPDFEWRRKQLPLQASGDNAEYLMPISKNLTPEQTIHEMQRPQVSFLPNQSLLEIPGQYGRRGPVPWVLDSQRITPTRHPQYFLAFH